MNVALICSPGGTCCGRHAALLHRFGYELPRQGPTWPQPGGATLGTPQQMAVRAREHFCHTQETPPESPRTPAAASTGGGLIAVLHEPWPPQSRSHQQAAVSVPAAPVPIYQLSPYLRPPPRTPSPPPQPANPAASAVASRDVTVSQPSVPSAQQVEEQRMVRRQQHTYWRCVEHVLTCTAEKLHKQCVEQHRVTDVSLADVKAWLQGEGLELGAKCQQIVDVVEQESQKGRKGLYTWRNISREELDI